MTDAVAIQKIVDGDRIAVVKTTIVSDGTGSTDAVVVDVSDLKTRSRDGAPCTEVNILALDWTTAGMSVALEWDANTDVHIMNLATDRAESHDWSRWGGITNNASTGVTGDIVATTTGHTNGDTAFMYFVLVKGY